MKNKKSMCSESEQVWDFFKTATEGVFVDVGANHPVIKNQTWFLEQKGWSGLLIEPLPEQCTLLRSQRPLAKTIQAAVCAPGDEGQALLYIAVQPSKSSLSPQWGHAQTGEAIKVSSLTMNSILEKAGINKINFLSLDIEGMEMNAMRGLNFKNINQNLFLSKIMCMIGKSIFI